MIHRRVARLAWLVLLASTLTAQAAATSPECPRWREAFAGMPTKMVTIQVGARTLALRAEGRGHVRAPGGRLSVRDA